MVSTQRGLTVLLLSIELIYATVDSCAAETVHVIMHHSLIQQVIAPGAARRYALRRRQFDSRRIYIHPLPGPHTAKLQAASVPIA